MGEVIAQMQCGPSRLVVAMVGTEQAATPEVRPVTLLRI